MSPVTPRQETLITCYDPNSAMTEMQRTWPKEKLTNMADENQIYMALFFLFLICYHLNILMRRSWIDTEVRVGCLRAFYSQIETKGRTRLLTPIFSVEAIHGIPYKENSQNQMRNLLDHQLLKKVIFVLNGGRR